MKGWYVHLVHLEKSINWFDLGDFRERIAS